MKMIQFYLPWSSMIPAYVLLILPSMALSGSLVRREEKIALGNSAEILPETSSNKVWSSRSGKLSEKITKALQNKSSEEQRMPSSVAPDGNRHSASDSAKSLSEVRSQRTHKLFGRKITKAVQNKRLAEQFRATTFNTKLGCDPLTHAVINPSNQWQNGFDQPHKKDCAENEALVSIRSAHSNRHEDRGWRVECAELVGAGASLSGCAWSAWTGWDGTFTQPTGVGDTDIIAGIESQHDNRAEDRRFKFKKCTVDGVTSGGGEADANWRNGHDGELNFKEPEDQWIAAVTSAHDNRKEDRVFKFTHSKLCLIPTPAPTDASDAAGADGGGSGGPDRGGGGNGSDGVFEASTISSAMPSWLLLMIAYL